MIILVVNLTLSLKRTRLASNKFILDGMLIDLSDRNNLGGGGSGGTPQPPGFIGYPHAPALPPMPMPPTNVPFNYPNMGGGSSGGGASAPPPFNYNIPPNQEKKDLNINTHFLNVSLDISSKICD